VVVVSKAVEGGSVGEGSAGSPATEVVEARVGIQLGIAKILVENCPTSKLGKKTKRASQPNSPATDSSDIPLRLQTPMNYRRGPFEFALLTSTRLAKDKTPRGSWPRVGHQNASVPNRVETTKFNASVLLYCWHSEGQGRCNGYELQVRIGILCGINPFSISSTDHPGSW